MLTLEPLPERLAAAAAVLGVCALRLGGGAALAARASEKMHECLGAAVATRDGLHAAVTGLVRDRACWRCAPAPCACGAPVRSVHVFARAAAPEAHALLVERMVRWEMLHRLHLVLELALAAPAEGLDAVARSPPAAFAREAARGVCLGLEG
jgi:hypothetical protein